MAEFTFADNAVFLLGKQIYTPLRAIVELCANSYDADAETVNIFYEPNTQVLKIIDDGNGMNENDIEELRKLCLSSKVTQDGRIGKSPQKRRKYLGCFGIGISSFLTLGTKLTIFSKKEECEGLSVVLESKGQKVKISDTRKWPPQFEHDKPHGTILQIENISPKLQHVLTIASLTPKLATLPLSSDFKIFFGLESILDKKENYEDETRFEITPVNIPVEGLNVELCGKIYVRKPENDHFPVIRTEDRGIYVRVHGRIIEKNILTEFENELENFRSLYARLRGIIDGDIFANELLATRTDFSFEETYLPQIIEKLQPQVQKAIDNFLEGRATIIEEERAQKRQARVDEAQAKLENTNNYCEKLGLSFKFTPQNEAETVILASQCVQTGILDLDILSQKYNDQYDWVVLWNKKKHERANYLVMIEVEHLLENFFKHRHNLSEIFDLLCWDYHEAAVKREANKYKADKKNVTEVALVESDPSRVSKTKHQKEILYRYIDPDSPDNKEITHHIRVYCLRKIIEDAAEKL